MFSSSLYPTLSFITGYFEASDNLVTAGQPTSEQFALVRDAGFNTVVNLAMPDSVGTLHDEDLLIESFGIEYIAIPVRWQEPTTQDLDQFFQMMDEYKDSARLFIHCIANKRVSVFLYLYRILREGWTESNARADLLAVWTPNEWWEAFIRTQLSNGKTEP